MKKSSFVYSVSAHVVIDSTDVGLIREVASKHYDITCQRSAAPGGFLWGWKNRAEWAKENGEQTFEAGINSNECNISMKILEQAPHVFHNNPEKALRCEQLATEIRGIFFEIQAESRRLNGKG